MIIKLFIIIGVVLLYFFLCQSHQGKKTYYYLTILFLLIREIAVPYIGDVTPVGVMAALIFLGTFSTRNPYMKKWDLYLVYLIFSTILAFAVSPYSFRAFEWAYILFVVMALAVIPPYLFDSEEDLVKLTRYTLITSFVFSLTTISAYYGLADGVFIISSEDAEAVLSGERNSRIYGLTNTNLINCICAMTIVLIPWARFKKKWLEWLFIIVIIYGGLLTLKRMTTISIVLALFFYFLEQPKSRKTWSLFVLIALGVVFFSIFGEEMIYRFGLAGIGTGGNVEDSSAQTRLDRNTYAFDAFLDSPFFGNGAGYLIYTHNGFYEILANCGVMGILLIFLRYFPKWKDIYKLNPWAICIVLFLGIIFLLESTINHVQLMAYLGVFLGGYYCSIKYNWNIRKK